MNGNHAIQQAQEVMAQARHLCVFSGSGLSAESGIPTFRDVGGIWERFPQEQFAEIGGLVRSFLTQPDRLREFVAEGIGDAARAVPNAAHVAIAQAEQKKRVTVATQNIDGLHQAAGSQTVHELHGSLFALQCTGCGARSELSRDMMRELSQQLNEPLPLIAKRTRLTRMLLRLLPRCQVCRSRMRPAIVFFGEQLPQDAWHAAQTAAVDCDAMLVVGTSATVFPAAMLPGIAQDTGSKIVVATLDPDFVAPWADVTVVGPATETVPVIFQDVV